MSHFKNYKLKCKTSSIRKFNPKEEEVIENIPELNHKVQKWSHSFMRQLEKNTDYELGGNITHLGDNFDDGSGLGCHGLITDF